MASILPSASSSGGLNPMSFAENQQGNAVLERLRKQRASGSFCDVLLCVGDRQLPAHRNVLAACSLYFDSILRKGKVVKERVTVHSHNGQAFELLLNYMYSGSVVVDRTSVMDLLKMANNFLVTKLKNYCAEYLDRYMDAANCLTIKDLADKYNMPGLARNAQMFLENHINQCLVASDDVLNYSLSKVDKLLCDPNYDIQPEAHMQFILRWINRNVEKRESAFKNLLAVVALCAVNRDILYSLLQCDPLLNQSENCRLAFLQAMFENSVPLGRFELEYSRLAAKLGAGELTNYFPHEVESVASSETRIQSTVEGVYRQVSCGRLEDGMASFEAVDPLDNTTDFQSQNGLVQNQLGNIPELNLGGEEVVVAAADEPEQILVDVPQEPTGTEIAQEYLPQMDSLEAEDSSRPSLKMTLKLPPLLNRKARLLGKHRLYRQQIKKTTSNLMLNRRRGRPPRFKAIRLTSTNLASQATPLIRDDGLENFSVLDQQSADEHTPTTSQVFYKCPHCVYTSGLQSRIQAHINAAHSRNVVYVCAICHYECKWNREYYMHMKTHFQGPPFECDTCDYSAERIQLLLTHRMKHTNERPYKCAECGFRCKTKTSLIGHQRSHSGEKPFNCCECGKGFSMKTALDQHFATHSDSRPFRCEQCHFSTKYQSHLISHKRIHSGDVFRCQFADCDYSSPKKSQLAAHLRTHLAVRAYSCRLCGRAFIEKSHLVRHERIHLADKPFKCEHCEYASSRRDKLKEHIQKHHGSQQGARQQRRKYRRARQLAALVAKGLAPAPDFVPSSQQQQLPPDSPFKPIRPEDEDDDDEEEEEADGHIHGVEEVECSANRVNQQMWAAAVQQRPSSALLPASDGAFHQQQPSPALSLNFTLGLGFETPGLAPGRDVMLGGNQLANPTPTQDGTTLVTPVPMRGSPHSVADGFQHNLFASGGNNNASVGTPPSADLHRPMSLPSLGAQISGPGPGPVQPNTLQQQLHAPSSHTSDFGFGLY